MAARQLQEQEAAVPDFLHTWVTEGAAGLTSWLVEHKPHVQAHHGCEAKEKTAQQHTPDQLACTSPAVDLTSMRLPEHIHFTDFAEPVSVC